MKIHALAPLALALSVLACKADENAILQIVTVCAPPADAAACTSSGKCDAVLASRPWVNLLNGTNSLEAFVEIDNMLEDNADPAAGRLNTHDAYIESYRLGFRSAFFNYSGLVVPAGGTVRAGESVAPVVPLIPPAASQAIAAGLAASGLTGGVVTVELEVLGQLQDGTDIESGPLKIAVEVYAASDRPGFLACPDPANPVPVSACPNANQTASYECQAATTP